MAVKEGRTGRFVEDFSSRTSRYDQLSAAEWELAWQEGRTIGMEETIPYALLDEEHAPTVPAPEELPGGEPLSALTRREGQVAALVARGLTNRQIATELTISEHTVATHLAKVFSKLGLSSRTQLSVWVMKERSFP